MIPAFDIRSVPHLAGTPSAGAAVGFGVVVARLDPFSKLETGATANESLRTLLARYPLLPLKNVVIFPETSSRFWSDGLARSRQSRKRSPGTRSSWSPRTGTGNSRTRSRTISSRSAHWRASTRSSARRAARSRSCSKASAGSRSPSSTHRARSTPSRSTSAIDGEYDEMEASAFVRHVQELAAKYRNPPAA